METNSGKAVCIFNNGNLTLANSGFANMFGYTTKKELHGKSFICLFKNDIWENKEDAFEYVGEVEGIKKDGTPINIYAHFYFSVNLGIKLLIGSLSFTSPEECFDSARY